MEVVKNRAIDVILTDNNLVVLHNSNHKLMAFGNSSTNIWVYLYQGNKDLSRQLTGNW